MSPKRCLHTRCQPAKMAGSGAQVWLSCKNQSYHWWPRKWLSYRGSFALALQGSNIKCQVILIGQQFTPKFSMIQILKSSVANSILGGPLPWFKGMIERQLVPFHHPQLSQDKENGSEMINTIGGEYNPTIINRPSYINQLSRCWWDKIWLNHGEVPVKSLINHGSVSHHTISFKSIDCILINV